jgi:hypothetical protein
MATAGKEALLYTDSVLTSAQDRLGIGAATVQVAVGSLTDPAVPAAQHGSPTGRHLVPPN